MKRIATVFVIQMALILALSTVAASTRLAIGTLGLKEPQREAELADLLLARLTGASEFELVERRELGAALKEASLSLAGLVRAKDAVRIGALLRADRFVLGSSAPINGTNRVFLRLVNARTGIIEAMEVFQDTGSLNSLAANIANFICEQNKHPVRGHRDYLAIGVVQNLGVNNRFADFPAQMRGGVAAGLSGKVAILERDVVSFLANEVRLDIAGLTDGGQTNNGQVQFAFWIVDGFYQSYEVAEPELQLRLRVERVQGRQQSILLQGKPDEKFVTKICESIEKAVSQPTNAVPLSPTNHSLEIAALERRGQQLITYETQANSTTMIMLRTASNPQQVMNTLEEATRVYESILLLDPENTSAKMRLVGCLLFNAEGWGGVKRDHFEERKARALDLCREVIASGDTQYGDDARVTLAEAIRGLEGVEMLARFGDEATDAKAKARFRYLRHDQLWRLEHIMPVEAVMPQLRRQLIDELTDVNATQKDPVGVNYSAVLLAFKRTQREQIVNAILPEMIERFPNLKPYLLLGAVGEQVTTNSAVIAQFLASLKECDEHPETVWHARSYFVQLKSSLDDERIINNKQYATIVAMALACQRAERKGAAPPLTSIGKMHLAQAYLGLGQWKEALELFNELPDASVQAKNECRSHLGIAGESVALPDSAWKDKHDLEKVQIAYECVGRGQWETAAAIMESIGHRTVRMASSGPWGHAFTPVLPALLVDEWRSKAGKPPVKDPMRFEIGEEPCVGFSAGPVGYFSFEVEGEDLWMGIYSQLKAFRGEGPFLVAKPSELHEMEPSTKGRNTSVCVSRDYIWAATKDDGLLELDRRSGTCRRLTMPDGLFLNGISHLKLQGQTLWIAYQSGNSGTLGTLDLGTHKFSTLTPNLSPAAGANSQPYYNQGQLEEPHQAPRMRVRCMSDGGPGEMWFYIEGKGLQRFRSSGGQWDTIGLPAEPYFVDMVADAPLGLLLLADAEYDSLAGERSTSGGLVMYDSKRGSKLFRISEGLPSNDISAVAVDGRIGWLGGRGFVAVLDLQERKVLRVAYISASRIRGIKLSPAHAWIGIACAKIGAPDESGNAKSGVYRVDRAAVEPQSYTAVR